MYDERVGKPEGECTMIKLASLKVSGCMMSELASQGELMVKYSSGFQTDKIINNFIVDW